MQKFSWQQINAWRLTQAGLSRRGEASALLPLLTRLGGVQAQLMSAAELALWTRLQAITPATIQQMLGEERSLVKTWAMRGTLHLLPTQAFGEFVAASAATTIKRPPSYYSYHKVTSAELDQIIETIPLVLSATPLTREQVADAVVVKTGNANLREVLLSGWGALLKPSARRGDICFGPNQGQNVTFVRPHAWLGSFKRLEPIPALQESVRRFLTTYGPATIEEFARWWGIDAAQARKLFKTMADELTTVEVAGWQAQVLTSTLAALDNAEAPPTVRLLPYFDPYTIAIARHSDYLLPPVHRRKVYRAQGWIAPVVLVDGQIVGIWEHALKRTIEVTITLFAPVTVSVQEELIAEAERLGPFLGNQVQVQLTGKPQ
ncbi:MAG: AlkZ family DNA glycosylase [Caldilineaceae bacterium]|nr:AlkZ family DNA glycosylase [Caldilineaceae bacterium]